jgi:Polyketide cyclase / dehydrase and lipid transport
MTRWVDTVELVIPADPQHLFDIVANPRRHRDIDGSGTVRDATDLPDHLELGACFGMKMDYGGPYTMTSTIIELEAGRRVAWQSRPAHGSSWWRHIFGGRIWRYDFTPVDGGTLVRESWDLTQERLRPLVWGYRRKTHANMTATLQRLASVAAE